MVLARTRAVVQKELGRAEKKAIVVVARARAPSGAVVLTCELEAQVAVIDLAAKAIRMGGRDDTEIARALVADATKD